MISQKNTINSCHRTCKSELAKQVDYKEDSKELQNQSRLAYINNAINLHKASKSDLSSFKFDLIKTLNKIFNKLIERNDLELSSHKKNKRKRCNNISLTC
jgi:hypothetical protein